MPAKMVYVIKFVADMPNSVKFYRDVIGLSLKYQSPQWSEFATGETILALHPASNQNPAGTIQLGFNDPDQPGVKARLLANKTQVTRPPENEGGEVVTEYFDPDGSRFSIGAG
jgi:predicted enzyme related to lactoylglutathione lyase